MRVYSLQFLHSAKQDMLFLINMVDEERILDEQTRDRMANSLLDFNIEAVKKFIKGQKEHGGKITDRDLDKEIRAEQLDLFWYTSAKEW